MGATVTISDELAAALEARRREAGMPSLDAAAEAMLSHAISMGVSDADDLGLSDEALRALVAAGEASGPAVPWNSEALRAEVRRRYTNRKAG